MSKRETCRHCGAFGDADRPNTRLVAYPRLGDRPAYKACADSWRCHLRQWDRARSARQVEAVAA